MYNQSSAPFSEIKFELTDTQRLACLRLIRSENVGAYTFQTLINHYGSAETALEALPNFSRKGGLTRPLKIFSQQEAEQELEALYKFGARLIEKSENDYPKLLKEIAGAPPLITVKGEGFKKEKPMVAIVGSRNASSIGLKLAQIYAKALSEAGFNVVSGLARGIDAAAHHASLSSGTIGVMAGGLNKIYPSEHAPLINQMLNKGGIISEMPFNHEPRAKDFPRRNRIIAGLAVATLVVEAADRSGTLITARLANEEGREVFAIPGSPLDPRSAGTNKLIKNGANIVLSLDDFIDQITDLAQRTPQLVLKEPAQLSLGFDEANEEERKNVLNALSSVAQTNDELSRFCQIPIHSINSILLELCLAGLAEQDSFGVKKIYNSAA